MTIIDRIRKFRIDFEVETGRSVENVFLGRQEWDELHKGKGALGCGLYSPRDEAKKRGWGPELFHLEFEGRKIYRVDAESHLSIGIGDPANWQPVCPICGGTGQVAEAISCAFHPLWFVPCVCRKSRA